MANLTFRNTEKKFTDPRKKTTLFWILRESLKFFEIFQDLSRFIEIKIFQDLSRFFEIFQDLLRFFKIFLRFFQDFSRFNENRSIYMARAEVHKQTKRHTMCFIT